MWLTDIELCNGSLLKDCHIFKEDLDVNIIRMVCIGSKEVIEEQFNKMPWGNKHRFVFFQNEDMNGKVNVMNIKNYTIRESVTSR